MSMFSKTPDAVNKTGHANYIPSWIRGPLKSNYKQMKAKTRFPIYRNGSFFVGLLLGTTAGLTAGWLLSPTTRKDTWHPLADDTPKPPKKQGDNPEGKSISRKKTSRSTRNSVGNVDEPTGRNVSNIDDLPDRG